MSGQRLDWEKAKWDAIKGEFVPTGEDINNAEEAKHQKWWLAKQSLDGVRVLHATAKPAKQTAKAASLEPDTRQKTAMGAKTGRRRKRARKPKWLRMRMRARFEELRHIESEEARTRLDGATRKLLSGNVPDKLSLQALNLKSKTHKGYCSADRYIGESLSKKRRKVPRRFS